MSQKELRSSKGDKILRYTEVPFPPDHFLDASEAVVRNRDQEMMTFDRDEVGIMYETHHDSREHVIIWPDVPQRIQKVVKNESFFDLKIKD